MIVAPLAALLALGQPQAEPSPTSAEPTSPAEPMEPIDGPVFRVEPAPEPATDPATEPAPPPEPPELAPEPAEPPPTEPLPAQPKFFPPPPPPPDGSGRLVGGSVALALALGAFAAVGYESAREGGSPAAVAYTFVPIGIAGLAVGTYLLVRGAKARRGLLEWERFAQAQARPSGGGLIVGGVVGSTLGPIMLITTAVRAGRGDTGPVTTSLGVIGGASLAVGITTLTVGLVRQKRYRAWRQQTFLALPSIAPIAGPTGAGGPNVWVRGVWVGAVGRF